MLVSVPVVKVLFVQVILVLYFLCYAEDVNQNRVYKYVISSLYVKSISNSCVFQDVFTESTDEENAKLMGKHLESSTPCSSSADAKQMEVSRTSDCDSSDDERNGNLHYIPFVAN